MWSNCFIAGRTEAEAWTESCAVCSVWGGWAQRHASLGPLCCLCEGKLFVTDIAHKYHHVWFQEVYACVCCRCVPPYKTLILDGRSSPENVGCPVKWWRRMVAVQSLLQESGTLWVILVSMKWERSEFFTARRTYCSMNASGRLNHCFPSVIVFMTDHMSAVLHDLCCQTQQEGWIFEKLNCVRTGVTTIPHTFR